MMWRPPFLPSPEVRGLAAGGWISGDGLPFLPLSPLAFLYSPLCLCSASVSPERAEMYSYFFTHADLCVDEEGFSGEPEDVSLRSSFTPSCSALTSRKFLVVSLPSSLLLVMPLPLPPSASSRVPWTWHSTSSIVAAFCVCRPVAYYGGQYGGSYEVGGTVLNLLSWCPCRCLSFLVQPSASCSAALTPRQPLGSSC